MAAAVGPTHNATTATGDVPGCRCSQGAIQSGLATVGTSVDCRAATPHHIASTHPCPLVGERIIFPKIVETDPIAVINCDSTPKEPEVSALVGPTCSPRPASGDVPGSRCSQRAVHSGLNTPICPATHCAASTHPDPFVGLRMGGKAKARQQHQHP